jgi:hypothetical protein
VLLARPNPCPSLIPPQLNVYSRTRNAGIDITVGAAIRDRPAGHGALSAGFHPCDSLVALLIGADHRALGAGRVDLDVPVGDLIAEFGRAAGRRRPESVVVIGYGDQSTRPLIAQVSADLAQQHLLVHSLLVSEGRYFCLDPECGCRARDGVPIDPMATAIAAHRPPWTARWRYRPGKRCSPRSNPIRQRKPQQPLRSATRVRRTPRASPFD